MSWSIGLKEFSELLFGSQTVALTGGSINRVVVLKNFSDKKLSELFSGPKRDLNNGYCRIGCYHAQCCQ